MSNARYFNTHGPVNPTEHYVVPRQKRLNSLIAQIRRGHYFTIYAPRQMGKTTLLRNLRDYFKTQPQFIPIALSFQLFEHWAVDEFLKEFGRLLTRQLLAGCRAKHPGQFDVVQAAIDKYPLNGYANFWRLFDELALVAPDIHVILLIDEFDGTPTEAISPLLQTWREFYLASEPPRSLHSVILLGLQNIATLKLGRSSPFNIARQLELDNFTFQQVQTLLAEYTADDGRRFAVDTLEAFYEQTGGHPFLVNRLAALITGCVDPDEVLDEQTDGTFDDFATIQARTGRSDSSVTRTELEKAIQQLQTENNYNFETLRRHAEEYPNEIINILFGQTYPYDLNEPFINTLKLHGIIRPSASNDCQIANPIYRQVLLAKLRPSNYKHQGDYLVNGTDFRPLAVDGALQMPIILSRFREFMERRGKEAFSISPMPQEITGQYLLMAYIDAILRQIGGGVFTEVPSGDGYLDLIISYQTMRYVVETKIWRGLVAYEKGLDQLVGYLQSESLDTGYYVIFHARPQVYGQLAHDELEFIQHWPESKKQLSKTIHVYIIRLGDILGHSTK
ncbi:MAG: AAA-like domain-containing protein [Chloroflexota bacterium]